MKSIKSILAGLKNRYKILIAIVVVIGIGFIGELFYNMPLLLQGDRNIETIDLKEVETKDFVYKDGVLVAVKDEEEGQAEEEKELEELPSITVKFDKKYLSRFRYSYETLDAAGARIEIETVDEYKNLKIEAVPDNNNVIYKESIVNVRKETGKITIQFEGWGEGDLSISQISLDNSLNFSRVRFLFTCLITALILFLIFAGNFIAKKIEWAFLGISLCVGAVMIVSLPLHKISWDEEIHFARAYHVGTKMEFNSVPTASPVIVDLMKVSKANWPIAIPRSEEEHKQEMTYLNTHGVYKESLDTNSEYQVELAGAGIASIGYLSQAFMLVLGKALGLPFGYIYMMGRFGNLLMYCFVVFAAIKNIKIGKRILTAISLLPTPLFLAATYGYDSTVYAFIVLGLSYIINEFVERDRPVSYKGLIIFAVSMLIGSAPKAVYIPLILLALFLPKGKFKSKKEEGFIKGGAVLLCALMMATFVLPVSGVGEIEADPRGGDTDIGRQLSLVFAHPLGYAKILLESIKNTFGNYVFGLDAVGEMSQFNLSTSPILTTLLFAGVVFTDHPDEKNLKLSRFQKWIIGGTVFSVICLVWTALYLAFTPVGGTAILGVQARYYLPLLLPIFLLFNTRKIKTSFSKRFYNTAVLSGACFITLQMLYNVFIINYF